MARGKRGKYVNYSPSVAKNGFVRNNCLCCAGNFTLGSDIRENCQLLLKVNTAPPRLT